MTISEILAEYSSALSYDQLPQNVVREAKREILDTIGAGIAGVRTEEAARAFAAVKEFDQMSSCSLG